MIKYLLLFLALNANAMTTFDDVTIESSLKGSYLTPSTVPYTDSLGNIVSSSVTPTQLSYVDFTSSGQTQLNAKEPSITAGTSSQYWRGDKTFQTLDTLIIPENTNLYFTNARAQAAISATSPLTYSLGVLGCQTASGSLAGCLTSSDWITFNSKEPAITSGTTLQYWRGDKSFQTLNTSVVPELTNLYYTEARVKSLAAASMPVQEFYVTKDVGNDANDCSLLKPCKTIQAGLNAAAAISAYYKQTIVHVAPASGGTGSSYNENITFSQQGITLRCDGSTAQHRACLISGSVTVDMTGTSGGANYIAALNESYMNGFVVVINSASVAPLIFSGTTYQRFIISNCYFDQNGSFNGAVVSNSGTSGGATSIIKTYDSDYNNNNSTNPTLALSAGRFWMYGTTGTIANANASGPSVTQSGATSSFIANLVQITGQFNLTSNTATATFNLSTIASGTNPCIVTPASPSTGYAIIAYFGCTSTNTNSITGSGVVISSAGNARISSSGDIVSTVTQATFPSFPQGELQVGAGAVSGTNVLLSLKNGHIKIDQTTSPTATVNANAGTSATCTVANATDTAGKITVTTGTIGTPATGTQCTLNFNKAHGIAPICTFSPASTAAASNLVLFQVGTATTTTQPFTFNVAGGTSTAYTYTYHCVETK